jgi:hypothetical protein
LLVGTFQSSLQNSDKNLNRSVAIGPIGTNGNTKVINGSFICRGSSSPSGTCPSGIYDPSATLILQKSSDGVNWNTQRTYPITGNTISDYDPETNQCLISENIDTSFSFTDSSTSTADFYYRILVTSQIRYLNISNVDTQILSVLSAEQ